MQRAGFLLFVILILLNVEYLAAQSAERAETERPTMLGASLAYSFTGYRDEVESLSNRYLNTFTYMLDASFEKRKLNHLLNFNFFIGKPRMQAPYMGYNHKNSSSGRFCLSYTLDYNLWGGQAFPGYIGGTYRTLVQYAFINDSDIYSPLAALILFSLDLYISQKWIINKKNSLVVSLGYPLLGYIIRPPYSGMDEIWERYLVEKSFFKMLSLGKISSFHNYWAFFGDLKYYYRINALILLNGGLGFELSHINLPKYRPRKDAMFQLNIGITFNFRRKHGKNSVLQEPD